MIKRLLVSREEISRNVHALGERISADYRDKELVLIGVLNGGAVFMADLMREISMPVEIDYIAVSSYSNSSQSSGQIVLKKDTDVVIEGKHILIVEDLIDTGLTLKHLKEKFLSRNALSVKLCTIFDKPARRQVEIDIDYEGIEIPDEFVVGYGLDYAGKYRNLPDVYAIEPR